MRGLRIKPPSPAMAVACVALVMALSGVGYAAATLPRNSVGTAQLKDNAVTPAKVMNRSLKAIDLADGAVTNQKLADNAVSSAKVTDRSLTLTDLGGRDSAEETLTVSAPISVPAKLCVNEDVGLFNPAVGPSGASVVGALVIATLTDASGNAAVDNAMAVVPSMVIKTSQGGAIVNVIVCNASNSLEAIPAGSVFHYRLVYPG
jgi:hypothetical protein